MVEPEPEEAQARRGNFYALVELMGESPVRSQTMDDIQSILQQTYYTAGGVVSTILEQAIQNAHASLAALNRRSPTTDLRGGILCVAIVQNNLIMASVGPGLDDRRRVAAWINSRQIPAILSTPSATASRR